MLKLAFFAHGCPFLFPPAAIVDQMNASLPICATIFHLVRGEVSSAITTVVLLAVATFPTAVFTPSIFFWQSPPSS